MRTWGRGAGVVAALALAAGLAADDANNDAGKTDGDPAAGNPQAALSKGKKKPAAKAARKKTPSTEDRAAAKAYFGFAEDFRLTRDQEIQLVDLARQYAPQIGNAAAAAQAGESQVAQDRQQLGAGKRRPNAGEMGKLQHDAAAAGKLSKGFNSLQTDVRDQVLAILTEKQRKQLGFADWQPSEKKEKKGKAKGGAPPPEAGKKPKDLA